MIDVIVAFRYLDRRVVADSASQTLEDHDDQVIVAFNWSRLG
jgi:hypothetical protein